MKFTSAITTLAVLFSASSTMAAPVAAEVATANVR